MRVLVWRRIDFRESSRLVTLLSRERGRFVALAKGAYRPTSPMLGRLDLLNQLEVRLAGRGIPLLGRAQLVHEPRSLRSGPRYLCAAHLIATLDAVLVADRPEPALFDLAIGGSTLLERAPLETLPQIVVGWELRLLSQLGLLASVTSCCVCGRPGTHASAQQGGLFCAEHRPPQAIAVPPATVDVLTTLVEAPGKEWPQLQVRDALGGAVSLVGRWLSAALERPTPFRGRALSAANATVR